jgi:hypothetical protein
MRPKLAAALTAALLASGCSPSSAHLTKAPADHGPTISVEAVATPLDPTDPSRDRLGDFTYAGGLTLAASDTARLHGLSDLSVSADGRLTSVSDEGDLVEGRIVLSPQGRLTGVSDMQISALQAEDGGPLPSKAEGDAEGLAVLADGSRLVSFERRHRIWLYPADGGRPQRAPMPDLQFPENSGMEALAPAPESGSDAYLVGAEDAGFTWTCRISASCTRGPDIAKPAEFGLVAAAGLPQGRTAWLIRAWDSRQGSRVSLIILQGSRQIDRMDLARPLTVDNFEGLAALPNKDGTVRFYLLSDDNFASNQRTLLLAFDWTPIG